MMTATEARDIASKKRKSGIENILKQIESDAKKGSNQTIWGESISDEERKGLQDLGYDVGNNEFDPREGKGFVYIKW